MFLDVLTFELQSSKGQKRENSEVVVPSVPLPTSYHICLLLFYFLV